MIYIKLNGQLGNHLFQIAAIKALAARNNSEFGVMHTPHPLLDYSKMVPLERTPVVLNNPRVISYHQLVYKELSFVDGCMYDGYYQSSRFFEGTDVSDIVDVDTTNANKFISDNSLNDFAIIHIRQYPGLTARLEDNYFARAVEIFKDKQIVFISDNINEVKSKFPGHYYSEMDLYDDFALLTLASYHAISNSTFSWWGAYLSNSKHVVAPDPWFKHHHTSDIVEPHWEKIIRT